MDEDVRRCWNAERSRRLASSKNMREIDDAEWERFAEHDRKRKHYTQVIHSHSASKAEKERASQELPRHSFGLQRKRIKYLPTFAARVALRVLQHGIGWWGEELHCIVCGCHRSTACVACGAAVCCTHRIVGGRKPQEWPKHFAGGMYVYCYDGAACEERWSQLDSFQQC